MKESGWVSTIVVTSLTCFFISCALIACADAAPAQPQNPPAVTGNDINAPSSFLPIWKLLSRPEKLQFIAGYIQGWRDAAKVTDIAISFVRENPQQAVEGMERVRALYELSDLKPDLVVNQLDQFYADPDNRQAPLSRAISAARNNR